MSDNHGNTPAAWSAVVVALIGFTTAGIGMMIEPISWVVFWIGAAITVAGGVVFLVMSKLGYHQTGH